MSYCRIMGAFIAIFMFFGCYDKRRLSRNHKSCLNQDDCKTILQLPARPSAFGWVVLLPCQSCGLPYNKKAGKIAPFYLDICYKTCIRDKTQWGKYFDM